mmetsp:Transcript_4957/g.10475  ORF Transcript_4957/g.10475 Transcript_4957/m.10475 type:complete len:92 (+) Transcript_4957:740-1015(+)
MDEPPRWTLLRRSNSERRDPGVAAVPPNFGDMPMVRGDDVTLRGDAVVDISLRLGIVAISNYPLDTNMFTKTPGPVIQTKSLFVLGRGKNQ